MFSVDVDINVNVHYHDVNIVIVGRQLGLFYNFKDPTTDQTEILANEILSNLTIDDKEEMTCKL